MGTDCPPGQGVSGEGKEFIAFSILLSCHWYVWHAMPAAACISQGIVMSLTADLAAGAGRCRCSFGSGLGQAPL